MKHPTYPMLVMSLLSGFAFQAIFPMVPDGKSDLIAMVCLVIMTWITVASLFKRREVIKGIHTYLRPDTLFHLFFYILFAFPYLSDIFGYSDLYQNRFITQLFIEHANRALIGSTVAMIFFEWGYRAFEKVSFSARTVRSQSAVKSDMRIARIGQTISALALALLFFILVATGAFGRLFEEYTGLGAGDATSDGVLYLMTHFSMQLIALTISRCIMENRIDAKAWAYVVPPMFWALVLLITGDRNSFLLIILVPVVGYSTYFFRTSILAWGLGGFVAFSLYQAVEISRSSGEKSISNVIASFTDTSKSSEGGLAGSSFSLTTTTLRASFHENPDGDALHYGKFKMAGVMGIVPYSRGLIFDKARENVTSAEYITDVVLGPNSGWSIGSNLVSDIIVDVGIIFVPIFMLIVGGFGGAVFALVKSAATPLSLTLYLMVCSLFFEYPRYSFDFPVRSVAWLVILFWLIRKFVATRPSDRQLVTSAVDPS